MLFLAYITADFVWLCLAQDALPSLHYIVLAHHVITFLLLLFPLLNPQFAHFTCLDGGSSCPTMLLCIVSL